MIEIWFWYILGACGILFIGIGIYIYFVVDRSIDNEVKDIIDSVNDIINSTPGVDPSIINDVVQTNQTVVTTSGGESHVTTASTSSGTVKGYDLTPEGSVTPKGGNNNLTLNENPIASTSAVASDLTKIIHSGQETLNKASESVKTIASNVVEKTQQVSGKVGNVVKSNATKLNELGRNLVNQTSEHISEVHQKATSLHNPVARPVIDTSDLISGSEAAEYSIPSTANNVGDGSPQTSLNNRFWYDTKPRDTSIDVEPSQYAETLEHYYQPSNPSSAQPNVTSFGESSINRPTPNPGVAASVENIRTFEQNLNVPADKSLNNLNHASSSPTTSRLGPFSESNNTLPRLGVRFSAAVPSPVVDSVNQLNNDPAPNLLIHPAKGVKFAAHLNPDFDNVKPILYFSFLMIL
jgi:hypothetical protein